MSHLAQRYIRPFLAKHSNRRLQKHKRPRIDIVYQRLRIQPEIFMAFPPVYRYILIPSSVIHDNFSTEAQYIHTNTDADSDIRFSLAYQTARQNDRARPG